MWAVRQLASKIQQARSYATAGLEIPAKKQKYVPSSGTYPLGFQASGVIVGVKPHNTTKPDLALLTSDRPCAAAAVFTKNKFQAAPVTFSRDLINKTNGKIQSVIVNSGNANAVTGKRGLEDAVKMSHEADKVTGATDSTIVMSTGVIGQRSDILSGHLHHVQRSWGSHADTHTASPSKRSSTAYLELTRHWVPLTTTG